MNQKEEKEILLVIERADTRVLWGRVTYNNNLLVTDAHTVEELRSKMTGLLKQFEGVGEGSNPKFSFLFQGFDSPTG